MDWIFYPPWAFFLASAGQPSELPLALLLVFGAAKLFAEIFERLRQPAIVGEITAGILLGPSVLGWVKPSDTMSALAELGVMFLLFRVGLEVKPSEILEVGRSALLVAVIGVMTPFFVGWLAAHALGYQWIEALFVGAAMVATSVGITAQVLASKGYLHHPASRTVLAAAVIDDVLGLIVLAIVSSLAQGGVNLLDLGLTALLAIGFTTIVAIWGNRLIVRLLPAIETNLSAMEARFNFSLVLLFALALLATYAGVAAIIGAFLAGMALAESVGHREHDLVHGVTETLVPFFLVGIGLYFDLSLLKNTTLLGVASLITILAVATKLASGLGVWNRGRADVFRVGIGMMPRGEVGMVVAQLGLVLGVISSQTYSVVIFMAIVTTMIAPPLLRLAYRGQECRPSERLQIV
ncbi:MAG: cation:proton antiporter [Bryobacteraceae bacterium]|nr:cation:proton antiporter [Bryobacteraceae bacterium]MDW8377269.1 cation:proton antiporter [Bryobacterales bacterium]